MASPRGSFVRPTLPQAVLFALILLTCSVDFTRRLSIFGVSGLGALTLAAGGAVWAAWLVRPVLPPKLLVVFLPLILFFIDAAGTFLWYRPGMDGVQLLTVGLTFLGTLMLTARETAADPALAGRLRAGLIACSIFPVLIWLVVLGTGHVAGEDTNLTRPFALYTLTIVAVVLSVWRGFAWPERGPVRRMPFWKWLAPLAYVALISVTVLLGMSRTALVAIAMLVPLSLMVRGNAKGITRGVLVMAVGVGGFAAVLLSYQPIYDRFFKEDASMQVGGVAINGSGRTRIWGLLLSDIGDDWPFGKGVSASEDLINRTIPNIGQPHNDYLRFYYDQGVVGLSLWLVFVAVFTTRTVNNLRRSIRNQSPDYAHHVAALLALAAVSFSMLTDNSYCYTFVMVPLAIVMGTSVKKS